MKEWRTMTPAARILLASLIILFIMPLRAGAAGEMEELLPSVHCGSGWKIAGKPAFYDRDTLSDLIDGEAELFFPYGFDRLAYARYDSETISNTGLDLYIYRMGSLLDAFGIYSGYRQKEGHTVQAGAESSLSGSQLFLYQGRYFVEIQITGGGEPDAGALAGCARAVVSRMKESKERPQELEVFNGREVIRGTERYLPQSLLGYDFFPKGIMADATVEGTNLQVFLLLNTTPDSAARTFDRYRSQLSGVTIDTAGEGKIFMEGADPLYGPVTILRKGSCLAGALKFTGRKGIRRFLESICR